MTGFIHTQPNWKTKPFFEKLKENQEIHVFKKTILGKY